MGQVSGKLEEETNHVVRFGFAQNTEDCLSTHYMEGEGEGQG